MNTYCKLDCCEKCDLFGKSCKGCEESCGHPCGGNCIAAECIKANGFDAYLKLKADLIENVNALKIKDLEISDLNLLIGGYVNLEYPLSNGTKVKFLEDNNIYFANQIERPDSDRCYGVVADKKFILICEYGYLGADPEIIIYKNISE